MITYNLSQTKPQNYNSSNIGGQWLDYAFLTRSMSNCPPLPDKFCKNDLSSRIESVKGKSFDWSCHKFDRNFSWANYNLRKISLSQKFISRVNKLKNVKKSLSTISAWTELWNPEKEPPSSKTEILERDFFSGCDIFSSPKNSSDQTTETNFSGHGKNMWSQKTLVTDTENHWNKFEPLMKINSNH